MISLSALSLPGIGIAYFFGVSFSLYLPKGFLGFAFFFWLLQARSMDQNTGESLCAHAKLDLDELGSGVWVRSLVRM